MGHSHWKQRRDPPPTKQIIAAPQAERAVIGQALLYEDIALQLVSELEADDYYEEKHQQIHTAIAQLVADSQPVDALAVAQAMDSRDLELAGGVPYLASLVDRVVTPANWRYYCSMLRNVAAKRALQELGEVVAESAGDAPFDESVEAIQQKIERLEKRNKPHNETVTTSKAAAIETMQWLQQYFEGGVNYLETGFSKLDRLCPINDDDLIILGARPSIGKTALALNIAAHVAGQNSEAVHLVSSEMSARRLMLRLMAMEARTDLSGALRARAVEMATTPQVFDAAARIANWPLYIDDTGRMTASEICRRAKRQHQAVGGLGLIVIDYLQNVEDEGTGERQNVIDEAAKKFKALAVDLQTPVLLLSQIGRDFEKRAVGKGLDVLPGKSDLRDSGGIEQAADSIWLLHRGYDSDGLAGPETVIVVAKCRDGECGLVHATFNGPHQRFTQSEVGL